jgi:hypothetical protein
LGDLHRFSGTREAKVARHRLEDIQLVEIQLT